MIYTYIRRLIHILNSRMHVLRHHGGCPAIKTAERSDLSMETTTTTTITNNNTNNTKDACVCI